MRPYVIIKSSGLGLGRGWLEMSFGSVMPASHSLAGGFHFFMRFVGNEPRRMEVRME